MSGASSFAYVTLVTNQDYIKGATALVHSLRWTRTQADIVVLYTGALDRADLHGLAALGCRLIEVAHLPLSDEFNERHGRSKLHQKAPFTKGRKPSFHTPLDNFCKLRLWELTEYKRCIFIDADAIVLRNIDRLFDYPEFCAAPNVYESLEDFRRLNSGLFVAEPNIETFNAMLAALDQPDSFFPRTDQTFLQLFFPEWHGLPVYFNMLQYVWFKLPALWDWQSVRVLHFQYEKPWEPDHPKVEDLKPLIELWRVYYAGQNAPEIANMRNPQGAL